MFSKEHFKQHYSLAFELRYRANTVYWLKWIREVFRFFQTIFFLLDFVPIDQICTRKPTAISLINNLALLNPGVYNSPISLNSNITFLTIVLIVYYTFKYYSKKARSGSYLNKFTINFLIIFFDFISPLIEFQLFFRFYQTFTILKDSFTFKNTLSLLLITINIGIIVHFDRICSVFFRPMVFLVRSLLDNYICSLDYLMFIARFLIITIQFILIHYYHFLAVLAIIIAYPIFVFFILEIRLSRGVHVTILGALLKDGPIFASPFMIFANLLPNKIISPGLICIVMLIIYAIIYKVYHDFIRRNACLILNEKYTPPWWIPYSNSLVMRYAARTEADVDGFENYILMRLQQNPDELLEVIRFLGLFKDHRNRILMILSKINSPSAYYDYQFYLISRVFRSYSKTPQCYIQSLDKLHRHFLVCNSLFWKYRYENKLILSSVYGAKASLAHVELVDFIKYLVFIHQFDPYVLNSYAEILLVAKGDPKKSVIFRRYANLLKDNPNCMDDPIFRHTAKYYPIPLQKYSENLPNHSSSNTSDTDSNSSSSNSSLRIHVDQNVIYRDEKADNSPVAMFMRKCSEMKTYSTLTFMVLMAIFVYNYMRVSNYFQYQNSLKLNKVRSAVSKTMDVCIKLTSGVLIHQQSLYYKSENITTNNCSLFVSKVYDYIKYFNFSYKDDYYFITKVLGQTSDILSDANGNNCENLKNTTLFVFKQLHDIRINYEDFLGNLTDLRDRNLVLGHFYKGFMHMGVYSLISCIITTVLGFVALSATLRNLPAKAVEFLGSKERLSLLLLKKSLESWDLFKILFPNVKENDEHKTEATPKLRAMKVAKYNSELDIKNNQQTSHHVNLIDAKFAISFIGADQLLKPSQFALLSPFLASPTPQIQSFFSETDTEDFSVSEVENILPEKPISKEKLENIDVINKSIEQTNTEYKFIYILYFFLFLLPWFFSFFLFYLARATVFFEHDRTVFYLNKINSLAMEIKVLPYNMYDMFKNLSISKSSFNLNQNLSWYRRDLQLLLEDIDKINMTSQLSLMSTTVLTTFFWLLGMFAIYRVEQLTKMGFDSLFHFPFGYLDHVNKQKENPPEQKMISSILEVIVIKNSRLISCISTNCQEIVGLEPLEIIGRKFEEIFPEISGNLRCFTVSQKKQKKFIVSCYEQDHILRYALYDTSFDMQPKATLLIQLSNSMPNYYARKFCENGISRFEYKNSLIVIMRYSNNEFNPTVDNVFNVSNNVLQCYSDAKLLRCQGSLIYFIFKNSPIEIVLLFIRDLIHYSKPSSKFKAQIQSPLVSFSISRLSISCTLDVSFEPFLRFMNKEVSKQIGALFSLGRQQIFIANEAKSYPNAVKVKDVYGKIITFDDLENLISNFI